VEEVKNPGTKAGVSRNMGLLSSRGNERGISRNRDLFAVWVKANQA
jgi:hypothetical protein